MRQECLIGSELYGLSHGLYLARRESGLRGRGGGYVGEGEHFPAFPGCQVPNTRNAGEAQPLREADRPHIRRPHHCPSRNRSPSGRNAKRSTISIQPLASRQNLPKITHSIS